MAKDIHQTIFMPELDKGNKTAVLELVTRKGMSGVYSSASIGFIDNGFITCMLYSDFRRTIKLDKTLRATQKNLDNMHQESFSVANIEEIKREARNFYAAK